MHNFTKKVNSFVRHFYYKTYIYKTYIKHKQSFDNAIGVLNKKNRRPRQGTVWITALCRGRF